VVSLTRDSEKFLSAIKPCQTAVICDSDKRRNLRNGDSAKQQVLVTRI